MVFSPWFSVLFLILFLSLAHTVLSFLIDDKRVHRHKQKHLRMPVYWEWFNSSSVELSMD